MREERHNCAAERHSDTALDSPLLFISLSNMVEATDRTIWDLVTLTLASLVQGQLPSKAIFVALLSKGLGLGIVAGSTMVKIPQVVAVLRARSADGLNPLSFELETLALAIAATYGVLNGLAFSAFGESVVSNHTLSRCAAATSMKINHVR